MNHAILTENDILSCTFCRSYYNNWGFRGMTSRNTAISGTNIAVTDGSRTSVMGGTWQAPERELMMGVEGCAPSAGCRGRAPRE